MVLKSGKTAPFDGVLLPVSEFRFERKEYTDCTARLKDPAPQSEPSSWLVFGSGLLIGLIGGLGVHK